MRFKVVTLVTAFAIACLGFAVYLGIFSVLTPSAKQVVSDLFAQADVQINGKRPWDIQVHNETFYSQLLRDGSLGFGESYVQGKWDCDQIDECVQRLYKAKLYDYASSSWPIIFSAVKAKLFNLQDKQGSLEVIDQHYQIGNDLYKLMLDPTLTYSCGYWKNCSDLQSAQEAKYDLICKKLHLKPGMKVLDIGCGWGGFAKHAAKNYGVKVVGITLSNNQAEYARTLTKDLPVEIRLMDYRDVNEHFDRVLEIGMFEHVGSKNYREFMEVVNRCLKENGLFMLHTIGANATNLSTEPWIDKYIFPNGHIPSIAEIGISIEGLLVMEDWHNFGPYYDKTLMAWFDNFNNNWGQLSEKYGSSFYRMWKYYLLSCAGCFRSRDIQLWQVVFSKDGLPQGYTSIR